MGKGLYHCSTCKAHFYDAEATAMHIKDKHKGDGEVLRHPTKRELIIRDEQQRARIEQLEKAAYVVTKAGRLLHEGHVNAAYVMLINAAAELKGELK